jgi:hypothetical protein
MTSPNLLKFFKKLRCKNPDIKKPGKFICQAFALSISNQMSVQFLDHVKMIERTRAVGHVLEG